jgi:hypothetical protein
MKIIDEQGRLFGRINIIDFLVILALCGAIPLLYLGYRILNKPAVLAPVIEAPKEYKEVDIECRFIKLEPETLSLLSVGDKEIDGQGKVAAQISLLDKGQPYEYIFDLGQGRLITRQDPRLMQIAGKIRLTAEVRDGGLFYKDKRLTFAEPFEFKSGKYAVWVVPLGDEIKRVEEKPKVEKTFQMYMNIKLIGLEEKTAKLISEGDKETDGQGRVIAEIVKKGSIESEVIEVDLGSGYHTSSEDATHKQVIVNMRLEVSSIGVRVSSLRVSRSKEMSR